MNLLDCVEKLETADCLFLFSDGQVYSLGVSFYTHGVIASKTSGVHLALGLLLGWTDMLTASIVLVTTL